MNELTKQIQEYSTSNTIAKKMITLVLTDDIDFDTK